jgi:hypothetical protein
MAQTRYKLTIRQPNALWTTMHKRRQGAVDAAFAELDRWERAERALGDAKGEAEAARIASDRGQLASATYKLGPARSNPVVQTQIVTISRVEVEV